MLITWLASIAIALAIQAPIADTIGPYLPLPSPALRLLSFVGIVLALESLFALGGRILVGPIAAVIRSTPLLRVADRILGIVPSIARMLVVIAIGLAALLLLPVGTEVRAAVDGSRIARVLIAEVDAAQPLLGRLVGEREGAPLFVTRLAPDESQSLDLPDGLELRADSEAERQLVGLVNEARVANGLPELVLDERLVPVARAHSTDMFRAKYFGHRSPTTGTHGDRLERASIGYTEAGENLAYAHTVAAAHRGLMDSPGHRANILRPGYTRLGIGVISAGPYGRMFTQLFLRP